MKKLASFSLAMCLSIVQIQAQVVADFETTAGTPSFVYGTNAQVVNNPDKVGNSSAKVAYYKKEAGDWKFVSMAFASPLAIKKSNAFSFKLRSTTKGRVYLKCWSGSTLLVESWVNEYAFQPNANTWTTCVFDLSKYTNQSFDRIELAASVNNEAQADVYIDDFTLYNTASPNGDPIVSLAVSTSKVLKNAVVSFDASASYDVNDRIQSWDWDFGDGTKATGSKVSHAFTQAGIYKVVLQVTNTLGLSTKKTSTIYVFEENQKISQLQWTATTGQVHEKMQASFSLWNTYKNPYNPDEVSVDAEITLPDGKKILVPCFYYIPASYQNSQWKIDSTQQTWMLRFSSTQVGEHQVVLKLTDAQGSSVGTTSKVTIQAGTSRGIIGIDSQNKQYFRHNTGETYYPLGINVAWGTVSDYGQIITNLANGKANFVRYWQVPFNKQALEWKNDGYTGGLGVYSQQAAAMQDSMINLAKDKNIRLQLTLLQHGMFSETVNSNWADNPYNVALGGPLSKSEEFFYNTTAKQYTKKLLRYVVARWGYSSQVFAWELFNEVQFTGNFPNQTSAWKTGVITWHDEMSKYLKSIDPFKHIVTTSADDNQCIEMDKLSSIDVVQYHLYNTSLLAAQNAADSKFKTQLSRAGVINGEYGLDVTTADVPFETQRIAIWTGVFSQVPHIMWLWDNYVQSDWANLFSLPGNFMQNKDFVKEGGLQDWNPTATYNGTNLGTIGLKTNNNRYVIVYDSQTRSNLSNAKLSLSDLPTGSYKIVSYNITNGSTTTIASYHTIANGVSFNLPTFSTGVVLQITPVETLVTGTTEEPDYAQTKVYPNPTQKEWVIEWYPTQNGKQKLQVLDITGNVCHEQDLQAPAYQLYKQVVNPTVLGLRKGFYLLKISEEKRVITKKLIFE